jgi:dimeric dUTPase (all-alpha-NTP-PPase superfamily)
VTPSSEGPPVDSLERLLSRQRALQVDSFGGDPNSFDTVTKVQYIKDMVLALTDELHEALNEITWKPWSSAEPQINRSEYVGELIDALHFLLNLLLAVGVTHNELLDRYFSKAEVNEKRQAEGYDNSQKCDHCGRATDEPNEDRPSGRARPTESVIEKERR